MFDQPENLSSQILTLRMKPGVSTIVRFGEYAYLHAENVDELNQLTYLERCQTQSMRVLTQLS